MQPNLDKDKAICSGWFRFCRLHYPALVFGLCAFTCLAQRAALGQPQVGSAETCFDEGPDKLPPGPTTPIPSLRAEMPLRIAQILQAQRTRPASSPAAKPAARLLPQNAHTRSGWTPRKKPPEGTLTAAR